MSEMTQTDLGRFRRVTDGAKKWFLWECPKCGSWTGLSDGQWEGRASVVCSGPQGHGGCDYHETHEFGKTLVATMQARVLTGSRAASEDGSADYPRN